MGPWEPRILICVPDVGPWEPWILKCILDVGPWKPRILKCILDMGPWEPRILKCIFDAVPWEPRILKCILDAGPSGSWTLIFRHGTCLPATDAPVLVVDRSVQPSSPSPPRSPTPTDRGPRLRGAAPSSYCLWHRFLLQRPCERQKTANFLQMHAKMCHFYCAEGHEN